MGKKTILLYMSFIALTFSANILHAQNAPAPDQISKECENAQKTKTEEDLKKCLEGDLTTKKDALVKKFKEIRPLRDNDEASQSAAPQQNTAPAAAMPVQPVTPVQPVVQPAAPAQQPARVNPYSY